ncbi:MAG: beta-ketoacyl-[acyl-carrier-protein] synthase family protein [Paludibacter sp.]|jgi:3-oxoacyl-[acyl-carrier-protein] synthase-1|nr:beta-ketoacyl-[acyl-carrier-protein] synthase family protein [Paludibacter sp.]
MQKIFITGMGIVSAIGNNVAETLVSLREKRNGIAPLRYLQTSHAEFPVGEVKMTNEEMMKLLQITENETTTRTSLMGMLAVREALENAHLPLTPSKGGGTGANNNVCPNNENSDNSLPFGEGRGGVIAFINGTTVGGMDKSEQFYLDFLDNDTKNDYIAAHDCGACTEMIADYFGIFSQVDTISTACSSAANAIILGAELLKSGRADIVVAGGAECITKFHLNGFNTLMILDKEKCRPFDASRAGLNLGEGAAYVVMERDDSGTRITQMTQISADDNSENQEKNSRKSVQSALSAFSKKPLAVLSGYANTCDAFHQTASSPEGEGAFLAMKKALETANLAPEQIDYINAHGTGTGNNDLSEGTAIQRLFGSNVPPVSSTKSFTGHTTSAAGGVEAVISILALQNNFIPENLNFENKMPELNFEPYVNRYQVDSKKYKVNTVLSNSFGFGGNDTALVFSKLSEL